MGRVGGFLNERGSREESERMGRPSFEMREALRIRTFCLCT